MGLHIIHLHLRWILEKKKLYLHDLSLITMSEEYNCVAKNEPLSIHVVAKWLRLFINTRLMYYVWNVIARNFLFMYLSSKSFFL